MASKNQFYLWQNADVFMLELTDALLVLVNRIEKPKFCKLKFQIESLNFTLFHGRIHFFRISIKHTFSGKTPKNPKQAIKTPNEMTTARTATHKAAPLAHKGFSAAFLTMAILGNFSSSSIIFCLSSDFIMVTES